MNLASLIVVAGVSFLIGWALARVYSRWRYRLTEQTLLDLVQVHGLNVAAAAAADRDRSIVEVFASLDTPPRIGGVDDDDDEPQTH